MKIVYRVLLAIDVIGLISYLDLSQFITTYNIATGAELDGLGRSLFYVPTFLQVLGIERYPGIGWFLFDTVVLLVLLALGVVLFTFSFKDNK